jgi:hypothetical protein
LGLLPAWPPRLTLPVSPHLLQRFQTPSSQTVGWLSPGGTLKSPGYGALSEAWDYYHPGGRPLFGEPDEEAYTPYLGNEGRAQQLAVSAGCCAMHALGGRVAIARRLPLLGAAVSWPAHASGCC